MWRRLSLLLAWIVVLPAIILGGCYVALWTGFFGVYGCQHSDYSRADTLAGDPGLTAITDRHQTIGKTATECEDDSRIATATIELNSGLNRDAGPPDFERLLMRHGWRRVQYQPDGEPYLAPCLMKRIGGRVAEASVDFQSPYRRHKASDFQVSIDSPPWSECGQPISSRCRTVKTLRELREFARPPIYLPEGVRPTEMSTCGRMAHLLVGEIEVSFDADSPLDPVEPRAAAHKDMGARIERIAGRPAYVLPGDSTGGSQVHFVVNGTSIALSAPSSVPVQQLIDFANRMPLPEAAQPN